MTSVDSKKKMGDHSQVLTIQNFSRKEIMEQGKLRKYCVLELSGTYFVYFKGSKCGLCRTFESDWIQTQEKFKNQNIEFGNFLIDAPVNTPSPDRNILTLTEGTNTPMRGTPYLVLYYNGYPRAIYKGVRKIERIEPFLINSLAKLQNESSVATTQQPARFSSGRVPVMGNRGRPSVYSQTPSQDYYKIDGGESHKIPNLQQFGDPELKTPTNAPKSYNTPWKN